MSILAEDHVGSWGIAYTRGLVVSFSALSSI